MMHYAFNHGDLRGKEDVSDLELDLLFWRRVADSNDILACSRPDLEGQSKLGWDGGMRLRAGGDLE